MRLGVAAAVVGDALVPGDVEVVEDRITAVGVSGAGSGLAVPGFIDVHVHGFAGFDFAWADEEALDEASRELTRTGVTGFRPTLISLRESETIAALQRIGRASPTGARMLGAHLEGPFLSQRFPGAHSPDALLEPDLELARAYLEAGPVGQMTLAPELPGALELIEFLVDQGVVVSLGHSDANAEVAREAFRAGAKALTHVFNAARPFRHRDPGLVGVALTRADVFVEVVLDGIHLADEAARLVLAAAKGRVVAVTDALAASGVGDGTYTLGDREVIVSKGEARLADGTLASSVLTMDQAFRNLISLGAGVLEASHATSTAVSELIGRAELGTLHPGTPADVVVLDGHHQVRKTLVAGRVVHDG